MDDVAAGTRNVSLSITAVMAYAYVLSLPTARACHVRLSSLPCRASLESLLRGNAPVQGSVLLVCLTSLTPRPAERSRRGCCCMQHISLQLSLSRIWFIPELGIYAASAFSIL